MAALVSIEYKQSIFFQSDPHTVIANKLVFTSVHSSNYTLKGLRSDKPWHKHDSNKISVQSVLNLRPPAPHQSEALQNRGVAGKDFLLSPPPLPFFCFFALISTFSMNSHGNSCYAG